MHALYGGISSRLYQELAQVDGRHAHSSIEEGRYSSKGAILQGVEVYSSRYNLCGKIDLFDVSTGVLTERKKRVSVIYDGYVFQLYGQYFGLAEMGHRVERLRIYSMDDNCMHHIPLPEDSPEMLSAFESVITGIGAFNPSEYVPTNSSKCRRCIYESMCDRPCVC